MREVASLQAHLDRSADEVARVVARVYEGLEQLASLALVLFQEVRATDAEIEAWAARELTIDPDGYLARERVLSAAMAGNIDPAQTLFYVHERFRANPEVLRRMYQLRNLGPRIERLHRRIGGLEWVYYQHPLGWAMSYPMHDPHGAIPADFDWLDYYTFRSVEPRTNPEREIRWTPPNVDYAGKGLMVSPSIPVYLDDGTFAGVWSMDLPVARLLEGVKLDLEVPGQDTFIIDQTGRLLAHQRISSVVEGLGSVSRESIAALGGGFADLDVQELLSEASGTRELRGRDGISLVCSHRRIDELGWAVVAACPAHDLFDTLRHSFQQAFARLGEGDLGYRIEQDLGGQGQLLVDAYNEMAEALQRAMAEREREQRVAQHQQRLQAIGQLSGSVAHDLNNLLTAMLGAATLIEPRPDDVELVEDIKIAVERASAMTTQLLGLSRDAIVHPRLIDLSQVCRDFERLLRRLIPEGIEIVVEAPPTPLPVIADPTQILQVLLNLVINARDAVGRSGCIRVTLAAEGAHACLRVADDGSGIPAAVMGRVFEPFFTTKDTGTGLGLATVRQIADALGGAVSLESQQGTGTRVQLSLPLVDGEKLESEPRVRSDDLGGARILVVDDDVLVLRSTVRSLAKLGCEVSGCSNASEALAMLERGRWDVLLTDVVMPGLTGRELAEEAASRDSGLRVVFMSGYAEDALLLHGVRDAHDQLLRKPFTPRDLATLLCAALHRES